MNQKQITPKSPNPKSSAGINHKKSKKIHYPIQAKVKGILTLVLLVARLHAFSWFCICHRFLLAYTSYFLQNGSHNTHFCFPQVCDIYFSHTKVPLPWYTYLWLHLCLTILNCWQTLDAVKSLQPKRALLIGMTHEFDHHTDNKFLEEWSTRYIKIESIFSVLLVPLV